MDHLGADSVPGKVADEPAPSRADRAAPGEQRPETLADLGEWELIRRLGAFAPPGQFADDAAMVAESGGGPALVINTDVLVEGIHFSDGTTAAADVGWRAAAANLSDLAAMGCTEVVGITVALVAPASTPWSWVEGVYGGLQEALQTYGGVLLGGDCSGGAQRMLAVTAIGRLAAPREPAGVPVPRHDSATPREIQPVQAAHKGEAPDPEGMPQEAARTAEQEGIGPLAPSRAAAGEGIGPMQAERSDAVAALAGSQPLGANQPGEPSAAAPDRSPGSPRWQLPGPSASATPGAGPIRRGDGRPGDRLVCTGPHGLSRLGLALLQGQIAAGMEAAAATGTESATARRSAEAQPTAGVTGRCAAGIVSPPVSAAAEAAAPAPAAPEAAVPETPPGSTPPRPPRTIDPELAQRAISAHQRPRPRFDAVRALINCRPAGLAWRVGGCDSSDGLAAAAAAIAASSGCSARLDRSGLPLDPAMASLPAAEAWCLAGGEDFELVLALEPAWAEALIAALPGTTAIGELVAGEAGALGWTSGEAWNQDEGKSAMSSGYSHFS